MVAGLADGNIASLYAFEGILYVLHDNDLLIRSWNIETGEMVSEIPIPRVGGGFDKQWEGLSIYRNDGRFAPLSSGLRGGRGSDLIVHLALDSPPEVWSFAVQEGDRPGELFFPSCAGTS